MIPLSRNYCFEEEQVDTAIDMFKCVVLQKVYE